MIAGFVAFSEVIAISIAQSTPITVASGLWDDPTIWNSGVVPPASSDAIVDNDDTVDVSDGIVAGTSKSTASLFIGDFGTGLLNVDGGSLTYENAYLGYGAGSNGTATITSGSFATSNLTVGQFGTGAFNINGGATVTEGAVLGSATGSMGTINFTGGTWTGLFNLTVGQSGTGVLNFSGGTLSNADTYLGAGAGSAGSAAISSGTWNSSYLYDGQSGTGTLNINGGTVTNSFSYLGSAVGSSGSATVASGGTWNAGNLTVGQSGTGVLNIYGGSVIGNASLGTGAGSLGTVNMTNGMFNGNIALGGAGAGILNMSGGTVTGNVTLGYSPSQGAGVLNMTGGTITQSLTLGYAVGSNDVLTISNGTIGGVTVGQSGTAMLNLNDSTVTGSSPSYVGYAAGAMGTATLTSGSWSCTAGLTVGNVGTGILNINGGTVNAGNGSITVGQSGAGTLTENGGSVTGNANLGYSSGSTGTAFITGGTWNGGFTVGRSGSGTLTVNGGTVTSSGTSYLGYMSGSTGTATIISGSWGCGTLVVGNAGAGTLNLSGGILNGTGAYLGSQAGSTGAVTVTNGTWTNSGAVEVGQSGTGTLVINGGTVTDSAGDYVASAAGSNGSVTVTGGTWTTNALYVGQSGSGTLNLTGSGVITSASGSFALALAQYAGSTGILNLGSGGMAGTLNASTITGGSGMGTVNFDQSGVYDFAPSLSGSLTVNFLGSGTTMLTGSSNYTGPTLVSNGILDLANQNALGNNTVINNGLGIIFDSSVSAHAFNLGGLSGDGNVNLSDNASNPVALTVGANGNTTTYSGDLSGSGSLTKTGTGTLVLTGDNTYAGTTTIKGGTLNLGGPSAISGGGNITFSGGILQYSGAQETDFSSDIHNSSGAIWIDTNGYVVVFGSNIDASNKGGLTKTGYGTLILAGSNTFTGTTSVSFGNLLLENQNALSGSTVMINDAEIDFDASVPGHMFNFGGLTGPGALMLLDDGANPVTLSVGENNGNTTFDGMLTGPGSLTKVGTGTLTLGGSNAYSGQTSFDGGIVKVSSAANLGAGNTLDFNRGTLEVTTGGFDLGRAIMLDGLGTIQVDAGTLAESGSINGVGGLTMAGSGTLVLLGPNGFSGATNLSGGTLNLSNQNALGNSTVTFGGAGALVFDASVSGGAFNFGALASGTSQPYGYLSLQDNAATPNPVMLTVGGNNASTVFSERLAGPGSLVKIGTGTLNLSGFNNYAGTTSVLGGTLVISGTLEATPSVAVGSGGTYVVDGLAYAPITDVGGTVEGQGDIAVAAITGAGTLAPGATVENSRVGVLTAVNNVTFDGTSFFSVRLGQTTGSDGDQLALSSLNTVNLNQATLEITFGPNYVTQAAGTLYEIINGDQSYLNNLGESAISGTFSEGSTITSSNGDTFDILYDVNSTDTGPGNDVLLKVVPAPEPSDWTMLLIGAGLLLGCERLRSRKV